MQPRSFRSGASLAVTMTLGVVAAYNSQSLPQVVVQDTVFVSGNRTLSVHSTNPTSGVSITVTPDINGRGSGSTSFTRLYRDGQNVTLSAPAKNGYNPFKRWRVGTTLYPIGHRNISLAMSVDRSAYADFYLNVAGKVNKLGAGCPGSNGRVPLHVINYQSIQQGPQQGTMTAFTLSGSLPRAPAVMYVGISSRQWGVFTLPLNLSFIGMRGCFLFHDILMSANLATGNFGEASLAITLPINSSAIGTSIFTTFAVVDPGSNLLGLVHSNALELVQGGNR